MSRLIHQNVPVLESVIGWFQKISMPIPQVISWNSEGEGCGRVWYRAQTGIFPGRQVIYQTGILKTWLVTDPSANLDH